MQIMGCKTLSQRLQCISQSDGILLKMFALLGKDRRSVLGLRMGESGKASLLHRAGPTSFIDLF